MPSSICLICLSELGGKRDICIKCKNFLVKGNLSEKKKENIICKICNSNVHYKTTREFYCNDCSYYLHKCKLCNLHFATSGGYCNGCIINTFICCICNKRKSGLKENKCCKSCALLTCQSCYIQTDTTTIRFFGDIFCNNCYSNTDKRSDIENKLNSIHDNSHISCSNKKYKCCICKDLRDCKIIVNSYDGYLDDVGFVKNKTRWEHYCPECKATCELIYKI